MKTDKIMTDNKLIAEFMGAVGTPKYNPTHWDIYITGCLDVDSDNENAKHFYTPEEMEYHTSWDWLMPVVDKIESFEDENRCAKYNVNMLQCWVEIINNDTSEEIVEAEGINKLQATYHAIVEFIKHINK